MKVLNLQCANQHGFEGWFASEAAFADQLGRGLVACPLCGNTDAQKLLSAPRLNLRANRVQRIERESAGQSAGMSPTATDTTDTVNTPATVGVGPSAAQGEWLQALRRVMAQTEDVGDRFADQARAMHHGDIAQRGIRGSASAEVAMELVEEGIPLLPLPELPGLKNTLQ